MVALTPLVVTNKPVYKNPEYKYRSPSDQNINLMCLIVILLASWFISCSFYLIKPSLLLIQFYTLYSGINVTLNEGVDTLSLSSINFYENVIGFNVWLVLSGPIIFFLFLKFLNILPKFWTAIGLYFVSLLFMLLPLYTISKIIYEAFYCTADECKPWLNSILKNVSIVALYLLAFHGTVTNFCQLSKVIKKTSRAISFFPGLFFFSFITLTLFLAVIVLDGVVDKYFHNVDYRSTIFLGEIYVCLLIFHFVISLISQCSFTWCCTENKKELTVFIILKSIYLTFRNHGIIILFNCTLILPVFSWGFFSRTRKFDPAFPYIGLKAYIVREWLISNGLEHVLPVAAAHEALKKKICSIFTRNWFVCFSFSAIFGTLLALFTEITKIIVFCGGNVIADWNSYEIDAFNQTIVYYVLIIYLFAFMFVSAAIGASVLVFNVTKDIKESVEQEVIAIKRGVGIELCLINKTPETAEPLTV